MQHKTAPPPRTHTESPAGRRLPRRPTLIRFLKLDKGSKVPLYVQLRNLLRHALSTGVITGEDRLPGVVEMSKELGINFDTVRKAYKELEREGLVTMCRGRGTQTIGVPSARGVINGFVTDDLATEAKRLVAKFYEAGLDEQQSREILNQALADVPMRHRVVFTECNPLEVRQISALLCTQLHVEVTGALLPDVRATAESLMRKGPLAAVVTTGFHLNEVRRLVHGLAVEVDSVITNMSPETRRTLEKFDKSARWGFVCRDADSIPIYRDVLRNELCLEAEPECWTVGDAAAMRRNLRRIDLVLTSPSVYETIKATAPKRLPVFNILDRVDPLSLLAIRQRLFRR